MIHTPSNNKIDEQVADITAIFADNLKSALHNANITQQELADAIGCTQSFVGQMVTRRGMPSLPNMVAIHLALGLKFPALLK